MTLVAVAWIYVVLLMAVAEAMSPQGSVLGALVTFVLYGLLPLGIVLYIIGTPARRQRRRRLESSSAAAAGAAGSNIASAAAPDGGGHAAADAVAAERKEV